MTSENEVLFPFQWKLIFLVTLTCPDFKRASSKDYDFYYSATSTETLYIMKSLEDG